MSRTDVAEPNGQQLRYAFELWKYRYLHNLKHSKKMSDLLSRNIMVLMDSLLCDAEARLRVFGVG